MTCTITTAHGAVCGAPAVVTFTATTGETLAECAEHAFVARTTAAPAKRTHTYCYRATCRDFYGMGGHDYRTSAHVRTAR